MGVLNLVSAQEGCACMRACVCAYVCMCVCAEREEKRRKEKIDCGNEAGVWRRFLE